MDIYHSVKKYKIPILMYHDICPDDFELSYTEPKYYPYITRRSDFDTQMSYLAKEGYRTISLDEFVDFIQGKNLLPPKPIIITFDDGQKSNYEYAFPILRKYGFKAVFFVIAGRIGEPEMLSWDEIKEMEKEGMYFGSHTLTHPAPATLSAEELTFELKESKQILEDGLGKRIRFVSSPTGYFNKAISDIAKNTGYDAVCTGKLGMNDYNSDLFSLGRIAVKRNYRLSTFESLLDERTRAYAYYKYTQRMRFVLRRLVGARVYEPVRSWILKSKTLSKS